MKFSNQTATIRRMTCMFASTVWLAAGIAFTAQLSAARWSAVGGDLGNARYSSLGEINSQNITKLGAAWVSEKVGPAPTSRAMPVIDPTLSARPPTCRPWFRQSSDAFLAKNCVSPPANRNPATETSLSR
jgi:hypothetical protein